MTTLSLTRWPALAFLIAGIGAPTACAPVRNRPDSATLSQSDTYDALDARLKRHWELRDSARQALLDRVVRDQGLMSREEWESLLAGQAEDALREQDHAALRKLHRRLIDESREESRKNSLLDLDRLRAGGPETIRRFCTEIPKGGMLHIHPWGTLDRPTAEAILTKVNPPLDFPKLLSTLNSPGGTGILYPEELDRLREIGGRHPAGARYLDLVPADRDYFKSLFFLPPGAHSFDRFTAVFTLISAVIFSNPQVDPEPMMWEAFLKRSKALKVDYVEVSRFIVPKPQWMLGLVDWAAAMEQKFGVTVRLHAAYARNKDAAFTRGKAEQLLKLPESPVLSGINILADESSTPLLDHGQTLYAPVLAAVLAGKSHYHRTAHAGELGDPRNVRDALIMGIERLGHGVKLAEDPVTLEWARLNKVPIEINLLSNLRLKVVPSIEQHPFLDYARLGLPVSLSTDDEGIFESTIADECVTAVEGTDITYDELRRFSYNAVRTAFAAEDVKKRLVGALDKDFGAFEAAWASLRQ